MDFLDAAVRACATKLTDAKSAYPHVEADNLPYICMDLMYQYTLLTDGFGMLNHYNVNYKWIQIISNFSTTYPHSLNPLYFFLFL